MRSTTRSAGSSRPRTCRPRRSSSERRESLTKLSEILLKRETIEKEQFERLLDGATEAEVFGDEAPLVIDKIPPAIADAPPERAGREAPAPAAASRLRHRRVTPLTDSDVAIGGVQSGSP